MSYVPTIEDIAYLAENQPDKFPSALQTLRSAGRALNYPDDIVGQGVREATVQTHYRDYLANGGQPLTESPIPQEPVDDTLMDTECGAAVCDCQPSAPCCVESVAFGCEHNSIRLTLPMEMSDINQCTSLAMVASKGSAPNYYDTFIAKTILSTNPHCHMGGQPKLQLKGAGVDAERLSQSLEENVTFPDSTSPMGAMSNMGKLAVLTKNLIFGDVESSAEKLEFSIINCVNDTSFNIPIHLYPYAKWTAANLELEFSGKYFTNGNFGFTASFGGSLTGAYSSTEIEIGANVETDHEAGPHAASVIPFLDRFVGAMRRISPGESSKNETLSYIEVLHKQNWGSSEFELVEHSSDHSKVGVSANITLGFTPIMGVKIHLDVIDALLIAASTSGVAAGLAKAIRDARAGAARGVGNDDSTAQASLHAAVFLDGIGNFGNGQVILNREPADDNWQGNGQLSGDVALVLGAEIKGQARIYQIRGTLSVDGSATSKIEMSVETLPPDQQVASKKLKARLEWDGVMLEYRGRAEGRYGPLTASASDQGKITLFEKEVLGEWTV